MKKPGQRALRCLLAASFLALFSPFGNAAFLHAPHDAQHGLACKSCHEYALSGGVWPPDFPPATPTADDTIRNFICLRCHDGSADAPGEIAAPVKTMHSSLAIGGRYAAWTTECVDCHDPHFQEQLEYSLPKREPFVHRADWDMYDWRSPECSGCHDAPVTPPRTRIKIRSKSGNM